MRETGIGNWTDGRFRTAPCMTASAGRQAPVSRLSLSLVHQGQRRATSTRIYRLPPHAAAGAQRGGPRHAALPLQHPRLDASAGTCCSSRRAASSRDGDRSEEWNRGAYLVEGLGHCGACHTPSNALGGDSSAAYAGRSAAGLVRAEPDRRCPSRGSATGAWTKSSRTFAPAPLPAAAPAGRWRRWSDYSTSLMTEPDLRAIAVYLKDQPAGAPHARRPPWPRTTRGCGRARRSTSTTAWPATAGTGRAWPGMFPRAGRKPGRAAAGQRDPAAHRRRRRPRRGDGCARRPGPACRPSAGGWTTSNSPMS